MLRLVSIVLLSATALFPVGKRWLDFEEMNEAYVEAFIAGNNFGMTRLETAEMPSRRPLDVDGIPHLPGQVQLVGLLEAPYPRIYEMPGNPTKLMTARAHTRALDDFERRGLEVLRSGADTVQEPDGETMRALGAIRARSECLSCHEAEVGDLLGAFVYRLAPVDRR